MRAESGDVRQEDLTRGELGSCPLVSFHYQGENRFKDCPETTQPVDRWSSELYPRTLISPGLQWEPVMGSRHSLGREWKGALSRGKRCPHRQLQAVKRLQTSANRAPCVAFCTPGPAEPPRSGTGTRPLLSGLQLPHLSAPTK